MKLIFDELNAVAMTVFFLLKNGGKEINHLKLMKLLYLTERKYLGDNGLFISNDQPISMVKGPVLSNIRHIINGRQEAPIWDKFISRKKDQVIELIDQQLTEKDLSVLNETALKTLNEIWIEFGNKTEDQLVEHTHMFGEWAETKHEQNIEIEKILKSLGKNKAEISFIINQLQEIQPITVLFQ